MRSPTVPALAAAMALAAATALAGDVADTPHNLSRSGPGSVRSTVETEVCIFCHTPHNSAPQSPLWNRKDPGGTYTPYDSSTLKVKPGQPTGASRLCLSCHDGTVALGDVLTRHGRIPVDRGPNLPAGRSLIGLDLSNDHPVSFTYADSVARGATGLLASPRAGDRPLLDSLGRVQCTSCHDPHDNTLGDFLLLSPAHGTLCRACHAPTGWDRSSHATSQRGWNGTGTSPWPRSTLTTVAANACDNCHTSHEAGGRQRLLRSALEEEVCLGCHSGTVATMDIGAEVRKVSAHRADAATGVHDPTEAIDGRATHAECVDCHPPHSANADPALGSSLPGSVLGASGMRIDGSALARASREEELCFKCHSDDSASNANRVPRVVPGANVRRAFQPGNPSLHPVGTTGRSTDVPSLKPGWTAASVLRCTDCHANDAGPGAGGTGPAGPHGSRWAPILERRYDNTDPNQESPAAYDLCYKCHERSSILGDASFRRHKLHVADERTSCSVCHDAHGVDGTQTAGGSGTHLVNFDTRVVKPNSKGALRFTDLGSRRGSCSLLCHGEDHDDEKY